MEEKKKRNFETFFKILGLILLGAVFIKGFVSLFSSSFENAILIATGMTIVLGVIAAGIRIVPPRHVIVMRDKITGKLIPKKPGLTFIFPGVNEVFKVHDCHPIVEAPTTVSVITKDAQSVDFSMLRSYWIDALEVDKDEWKGGEKGKERAILAAIKIPGEKKEEIVKKIQELVRNFSEAHLKRFVAQANLDDLERDVIPEGFEVVCPRCGERLVAKKKGEFPEHCDGEITTPEGERIKCDAKWSESRKETSFPQSLLALISFTTSIWTDHDLAERFGIGCEIRILSREMPEELADAKLKEQVFEAKEKAKKAEKKAKIVEGEMLQEFYKRTKIPSSLVYTIDQIVRLGEGIISVIKEKKEEEKKEGGENK